MRDKPQEPEFYITINGNKTHVVPCDIDDMISEYSPSINKHLDGFSGINGKFQSSIIRYEN